MVPLRGGDEGEQGRMVTDTAVEFRQRVIAIASKAKAVRNNRDALNLRKRATGEIGNCDTFSH